MTARPPGATYRVRKWIRRNRVVFGAATAVFVALVGGLAVSTVMFVREQRARGEVDVQRAASDRQRREFQHRAYASDMKLAQHLLEAYDLEHALEIVDRYRPASTDTDDLRGFEWRYLWQLCQGDPHDFLAGEVGSPWTLAVSPDGTLVAAASDDGRDAGVTVWRLETREIVARLEFDPTLDGDTAGAVFSEDGRWLVTACHRRVKFFEVGTWREHPQRTLDDASGPIDWRGDTLVTTAVGHMKDPSRLDGLIVWNTRARTSRTIPDVTGPPTLSPDGRRLVLRSEAGLEIRSVDNPNSPPLLLEGSRGVLVHGSGFGSLKREMAFSPDGRRIAAAGLADDRGRIPVIVWNASDGRRVDENRLIGHAARVHGLAWASDSHRIATAAADGTIRVWDVEGRREPIVLTGHLSEPWCVAFVPRSDTIVSSGGSTGRDKIKIWDLNRLESETKAVPEWLPLWLSKDGDEVFTASKPGEAIYRKRLSGEILAQLDAPPGAPSVDDSISDHLWVRDERAPAIFLGFPDGRVASWGVGANRFPRLIHAHDGAVRAITAVPARRLLVTGGDDREIRWWDIDTGRLVDSNGSAHPVTALALSPDGRTLMSASCATNLAER
ncbi:MAG: hypothetical protein JNL97_07215, partial [Verrucomicrobiales bacterium]|nr:hypothetical protein [Verrucomicrobiales bacterium]